MREDNEYVCPVCKGSEFRAYKLNLEQCVGCSLVLSPAIWQSHANEILEDEWFGEGYQPQTEPPRLSRRGIGSKVRRLCLCCLGLHKSSPQRSWG